MHNTVDVETAQRIDPIWKRLRFERVWRLSMLGLWIALTISVLITDHKYPLWYIGYLLVIFLFPVGNYFFQERFWRRIGSRRLEALHNPQSFFTPFQPAPDRNEIAVPAQFRLHAREKLLWIGGVVLLVVFSIIIFGIMLASSHATTLYGLLIAFGVVLFLCLVAAIIVVIGVVRAQQTIEISEEGIKTRYLRQERFLRWDEARIFAAYNAQGMNKSPIVRTYEIASEQVVVRWSKEPPTTFFLKPDYGIDTTKNEDWRKDWNWHIERVNSLVAARTGLSLLNFDDNAQQKSGSAIRSFPRSTVSTLLTSEQNVEAPSPIQGQHIETSAPAPITVAQEDPHLKRVQWRGETTRAILLFMVISLTIFGVGCFFLYTNQATHTDQSLGIVFIVMGGLLFLLFGLMSLLVLFSRRSLERLQAIRQRAVQQPERFKATTQPTLHDDLPQPASIHMHNKKSIILLISFILDVIIFLIVFIVLFQPANVRTWLIVIIGTIFVGLAMGAFTTLITKRSTGLYIEVTPDGISTRVGAFDGYVRWQDARLFAEQKPARTLWSRASRLQRFELSDAHIVVRWQYLAYQIIEVEPKMSREELDRWMEQLNGYVAARTGLPLVDLDVREV